jgi:hypothetical protein
MFRLLLYDHPQGSSFILSAFTTFRLEPKSGKCTKYKGRPKHIEVFNYAFTKHF